MATTSKTPSYKDLRPASAAASRAAQGSSRKKDTKPEATLRKLLWSCGYRYHKDVASLPGRPDLVFASARVAVFCDGDFWHGRDWQTRRRKLEGGHNARYWVAKIARNMERDRVATQNLEAAGWTVLRLWETDILKGPEAALERVIEAIENAPDSAELK